MAERVLAAAGGWGAQRAAAMRRRGRIRCRPGAPARRRPGACRCGIRRPRRGCAPTAWADACRRRRPSMRPPASAQPVQVRQQVRAAPQAGTGGERARRDRREQVQAARIGHGRGGGRRGMAASMGRSWAAEGCCMVRGWINLQILDLSGLIQKISMMETGDGPRTAPLALFHRRGRGAAFARRRGLLPSRRLSYAIRQLEQGGALPRTSRQVALTEAAGAYREAGAAAAGRGRCAGAARRRRAARAAAHRLRRFDAVPGLPALLAAMPEPRRWSTLAELNSHDQIEAVHRGELDLASSTPTRYPKACRRRTWWRNPSSSACRPAMALGAAAWRWSSWPARTRVLRASGLAQLDGAVA